VIIEKLVLMCFWYFVDSKFGSLQFPIASIQHLQIITICILKLKARGFWINFLNVQCTASSCWLYVAMLRN